MQNGLDHETPKAPDGVCPASPEDTVIDNWTLDQLIDFCEQSSIDYPIGATREDLMNAIMASGLDYPVESVTAEEITEPDEVVKQLLLAQMELIVHASEKANKGHGADDVYALPSKTLRGDQHSPANNDDGNESDPVPLYRVICALSESMATCARAYAELVRG